jgi:hypothetical protein
MLRKTCLTLCAALLLAAWTLAEDYKGAVITKVEKTKATIKVDDKEIQVTLGRSSKVYDADGKELKGNDSVRILKEDNEVDITTAKSNRGEIIKEIHLVKGELASKPAKKTSSSTPAKTAPSATPDNTTATTNVYKDATISKVDRGKFTVTVDGKDVELGFGGPFKAFDQNDKEVPFGTAMGMFKVGNTLEVTATTRGRSQIVTQVKLIKGDLTMSNLPGKSAGSTSPSTRTASIDRLKSDWDTTYYKDAKVGDFVEYQDGNGQPLQRLEITEAGDHYVVQSNTVYILNRKDTNAVKMNFTVGEPTAKFTVPERTTKKTSDSTAKVGSNELKAQLIESYDKSSGKLVNKKWVSPEVPFDGLVREERGDGTVIRTLSSFGRGK